MFDSTAFDLYPYVIGRKKPVICYRYKEFLSGFSLSDVKGCTSIGEPSRKIIVKLDLDCSDRWLAAGLRNGDISVMDTAADFQQNEVRRFMRSTITSNDFVSNQPNTSAYFSASQSSSSSSVKTFNKKPNNSTTLQATSSMEGHKGAVTSIQWYAVDSGIIFSSSLDKNVKIWDVENKKVVRNFRFDVGILNLAQCPCPTNYHLLALSCIKDRVYIVDLLSGRQVHKLSQHRGPVFSLAWSTQNENHLVSGGADGKCFLWDLRNLRTFLRCLDQFLCRENDANVQSESTAHDGSVLQAAFTNDGSKLMTFGADSQYRFWNLSTFKNDPIYQGSILPKSNALVPAHQFDLICQNETTTLTEPLGLLPDNNEVVLLDLISGEQFGVLRGHCQRVNCCLFNKRNEEIYTSGEDGNLMRWTNASHISADYAFIK